MGCGGGATEFSVRSMRVHVETGDINHWLRAIVVFLTEGAFLVRAEVHTGTHPLDLAAHDGAVVIRTASFVGTLVLAVSLPRVLVSELHHALLFADLCFELPEFPVLLELLLFFEDDVIFQWRQVRADLQLNLLLSHVLEHLVLLVERQPLRIIDVSEFVVLPPVVLLLALLALPVVGLEVLLEGFVFA